MDQVILQEDNDAHLHKQDEGFNMEGEGLDEQVEICEREEWRKEGNQVEEKNELCQVQGNQDNTLFDKIDGNTEEEKNELHQVEGNIEEGKNELCPRIGMEFNSEEDAYDFYCSYALKNGFSVRKGSTCRSKSRTNELIGRTYVCSRQGVKELRTFSREPPNKGRSEYRTGCKAYITIRKRNGNKWVVSKYLDEHNHEMDSPSEMHVHRPLKKRTEAKKKILEKMCMSAIQMRPVVNGVVPKVGESSSVGFIKKGGRNGLSTKRDRELKRENVEALLNFFEKQQTEDPTFFYSIQVDSESQLTNFFWTDAKSRIDYHHFGDVVCFEPSYEINRSGLPFIPILGIDNHCQIVLFGSALLFSDSEESFEWLTRTWMNAMIGKEPKVVLIGNDSPIEEVIEHMFPGCCHQFCTWKVIQNTKKILDDVINANEDFIHEFTNCVNNNYTVECFESDWSRMVERYGLRENNWLVKLFENRRKWAPAYSNGIFLASLFNDQHTEDKSMYFDDYLKEDMPLSEFVKKFHTILLEKREKESEESNYTSPSLRLSIDIETEAANTYTKGIFQKFQEQLFEGISYRHKKVSENGQTSTYSVWKTGQEKLGHSVSFDYSTISAKCSCQLFESAGYLCRHVLKIFLVENVQNLLPQYVLKRWTKDAKSGSIVSDQGENMQSSCEDIEVRYNNLFYEAINISDKGSSSMKAFEIAIQCLHNTVKEVEAAFKKVITPAICDREDGKQNNGNTFQGCVEKSSGDQNSQPVVPCPDKGSPKVMNPRTEKLPVKKSSTRQTMQNISQNWTSSQISFATDEILNEYQQKRRKVGQSLLSSIGVETGQSEMAIQSDINGQYSEDVISHPYYQPSSREFEFHTLDQASPATIGQDLSHSSQIACMIDAQPFSLVSQDSTLVSQTLSTIQHDAVASSSSCPERCHFGQGTTSLTVLRSQQPQWNTRIDLNGPNRDSS